MLANFRELEELLASATNYERVSSLNHDKEAFGLERMFRLVEALGRPDRDFPTVHIAGTKGKGSTTLMLEALLRAAGYSVGTYTSPHVEHIRERIRVNGEAASEALIVARANGMLTHLEALRALDTTAFPSFFEIMTALAMACFKDQRVDWGLFEVGLGGRLDATNVLSPRLTCITSIGLEHTRELGNTLARIAREKAGIIKADTPLILGPLLDEALDPILDVARERNAPVERLQVGHIERAGANAVTIAGLGSFPAPAIVGPALRTDLGLAVLLFRRILAERGQLPCPQAVARALETLVLPARIERFPISPPVVLDAAHTAESIRALRVALDEIAFPTPRTLVFSLAAGKNLPDILRELPAIADDLIWTLADPVRSIPPEQLRVETGVGDIVASPRAALAEALARNKPVVVTGSFYLAGALRPLVRALADNKD